LTAGVVVDGHPGRKHHSCQARMRGQNAKYRGLWVLLMRFVKFDCRRGVAGCSKALNSTQ